MPRSWPGRRLQAVRDGRTRIQPEQHEKTYFHWLENIEPWCISRQLWWGHQIPVWYGPSLASLGLEGDAALVPFCAESKEAAAKRPRPSTSRSSAAPW